MSSTHTPTPTRNASLYRMVMEEHTCPWGLKAKDLLEREGYTVEDHWLKTREETEAFKLAHQVQTTPQIFINGQRIGGYDDLRRHLGKSVHDPKAVSYRPVIAVFAITALMALATSHAVYAELFTVRAAEWFIAFSMVVLATLKLQNLEGFSTMFLNYDLLARRQVRYGYVYPFAEAGAGLLMVAGALNWLSIPVALFIGSIGAVSVFKAVYIDRRQLKCACVGGDSKVPLGFVSLTENLMMVGMALWMAFTMGTASMAPAAPADPHASHSMQGGANTASSKAYMAGMEKMNRDMNAPMSGDADKDFVAMMIPHHEGAIDMARVQLQFGHDPELRKLSGDIVKAQDAEIAQMKAWQTRNLR
jgi:glutaredoxin